MKKLLIVIFAIGIITGMASMSFAYPGSVTLDATLYSGSSWSSGLQMTNFEANTYIFSVDLSSSAWSTQNLGTTNLGARGYLWSFYIYQPSTGNTYFLGDESFTNMSDPNDGVFFPNNPSNSQDIQDAIDAAVNASYGSTLTINHTSGGDLWFYFNDAFTRDNEGSVTFNVAVVPEPISSSLFIIGGVVLGGRTYIKRKKAKARI